MKTEYKSEKVCKKIVKKTKFMNSTDADESEFITVLLCIKGWVPVPVFKK